MNKIEVVRGGDLANASGTAGVARGKAFETPAMVQQQSRIAGGVTTGWHHHGERELYGFLVAGRLRIEDAEGDAVELSSGDFFHIPAGNVHRDVNLDGKEEAWVVNVMLGGGPTAVNVDDPRAKKSRGSRR